MRVSGVGSLSSVMHSHERVRDDVPVWIPPALGHLCGVHGALHRSQS